MAPRRNAQARAAQEEEERERQDVVVGNGSRKGKERAVEQRSGESSKATGSVSSPLFQAALHRVSKGRYSVLAEDVLDADSGGDSKVVTDRGGAQAEMSTQERPLPPPEPPVLAATQLEAGDDDEDELAD